MICSHQLNGNRVFPPFKRLGSLRLQPGDMETSHVKQNSTKGPDQPEVLQGMDRHDISCTLKCFITLKCLKKMEHLCTGQRDPCMMCLSQLEPFKVTPTPEQSKLSVSVLLSAPPLLPSSAPLNWEPGDPVFAQLEQDMEQHMGTEGWRASILAPAGGRGICCRRTEAECTGQCSLMVCFALYTPWVGEWSTVGCWRTPWPILCSL